MEWKISTEGETMGEEEKKREKLKLKGNHSHCSRSCAVDLYPYCPLIPVLLICTPTVLSFLCCWSVPLLSSLWGLCPLCELVCELVCARGLPEWGERGGETWGVTTTERKRAKQNDVEQKRTEERSVIGTHQTDFVLSFPTAQLN